jgi:hypothetical protein
MGCVMVILRDSVHNHCLAGCLPGTDRGDCDGGAGRRAAGRGERAGTIV